MTPSAGFFAGLGCGLTILAATALRPVSPRWLRWLLLGLMLVQSVYHAVPVFWPHWPGPNLWVLATTGLLVSSVFAIDQLLRHPAMSPQRLLRWCLPLLIAAGIVSLLLSYAPAVIPDRLRSILTYEAVPIYGSLGFSAWALMLLPKIPSPVMRRAVGYLAAGHAMLAGMILFSIWRFRMPIPLFRGDLLLLVILWYAYDLAYRLDVNR